MLENLTDAIFSLILEVDDRAIINLYTAITKQLIDRLLVKDRLGAFF